MLTIIAMLVALPFVTMLYGYLGDTQPLWDSAILIVGATASLYVFLGHGDSYSLWLASDVLNILLWFNALQQGLSPASLAMLVSVLMYTFTAIYGKTHFWKR